MVNNHSQDIAKMAIQANVHKTLVVKISSSSTQHKYVQVWHKSPFKPSKQIYTSYIWLQVNKVFTGWFICKIKSIEGHQLQILKPPK